MCWYKTTIWFQLAEQIPRMVVLEHMQGSNHKNKELLENIDILKICFFSGGAISSCRWLNSLRENLDQPHLDVSG